MKTKVPKRKSFGGEGDAGDAAHSAAMKEFSLSEFGSSHVQSRTLEARMAMGQRATWDNGGYYVCEDAVAADSIAAFVAKFKAGGLERKQLG